MFLRLYVKCQEGQKMLRSLSYYNFHFESKINKVVILCTLFHSIQRNNRFINIFLLENSVQFTKNYSKVNLSINTLFDSFN